KETRAKTIGARRLILLKVDFLPLHFKKSIALEIGSRAVLKQHRCFLQGRAVLLSIAHDSDDNQIVETAVGQVLQFRRKIFAHVALLLELHDPAGCLTNWLSREETDVKVKLNESLTSAAA